MSEHPNHVLELDRAGRKVVLERSGEIVVLDNGSRTRPTIGDEVAVCYEIWNMSRRHREYQGV